MFIILEPNVPLLSQIVFRGRNKDNTSTSGNERFRDFVHWLARSRARLLAHSSLRTIRRQLALSMFFLPRLTLVVSLSQVVVDRKGINPSQFKRSVGINGSMDIRRYHARDSKLAPRQRQNHPELLALPTNGPRARPGERKSE